MAGFVYFRSMAGFPKAPKALLFALAALGTLVIGCIAAQALWHATHHRYDQPNTGFYHGSIDARFDGINDDVYSFRLQGESEPRWRWIYSTNIIYRSLQFEWARFDTETGDSKGKGTLRLPSLAYESTHGRGFLTRGTLNEWLLGTTNGTGSQIRSADAVFSFIEAAGHGLSPAPSHHRHYFEHPVRGHIQHHLFGFGVGGFVYIWIGVWLIITLFAGKKLMRA